MDQRSSIFDEASRKRGEAKPSNRPANKPAAAQSDPFGLDRKKEAQVELDQFDPETMTLKDVERMISNVRQLHDEIDRKLDEIYQKSGWSPKYIETFLDNPNNFTREEWERVQLERQNFLNSLKTEKELAMAPATKTKSQQDRETLQSTKERRGKTIGARRNWIPMK
ncbi:conserved hypothetical protein [Candidatus Protochlamydia naegleriophila]|uniref:Uncharacterized protein n=1 Tax=Candidatus Protochlamydia naegleriophila TaxID=389348 RepID=A0A0U5JAL7_9BACT|nr:hypothetical protein [Candidatus Protochlamydia naegleriophila]CUI15714.1 conserved hypothetical protein [Candidatus Protochlamydia naegleriophila]